MRLAALSAAPLLAGTATAQTSSLVNSSTRGVAGNGDAAMISGFVVNAPAGQLRWLLIRGVGPSLTTYGVATPLADPAIQVRASNGTVIGVNDNVATASNLRLLNTVTAGAGAFPLTSANDAAMLIGVPSGAYTVQLPANLTGADCSARLSSILREARESTPPTSWRRMSAPKTVWCT